MKPWKPWKRWRITISQSSWAAWTSCANGWVTGSRRCLRDLRAGAPHRVWQIAQDSSAAARTFDLFLNDVIWLLNDCRLIIFNLKFINNFPVIPNKQHELEVASCGVKVHPGHLRQLKGQGLARSFVKLRQQTETPSSGSRLWNNGGSQEGTKARVERAETPILKLSTRGSPPASRSSKALVSILPYSAKDWLNDEAKVSQVSQVSQTERTLKPSGERVEAPQPPELAKNEWQRSRNKLIDGSPSRRSRVESKSPKRTNPSLSPSSRRSNRSRDALSPENSPFQMDGPSEVRFSETLKNPSEDTKGFEDSQVISSFESRIQALQQKARGLPRPHMDACLQ